MTIDPATMTIEEFVSSIPNDKKSSMDRAKVRQLAAAHQCEAVADLLKLDEMDILRTPRIGRKTITVMRETCERLGIEWDWNRSRRKWQEEWEKQEREVRRQFRRKRKDEQK